VHAVDDWSWRNWIVIKRAVDQRRIQRVLNPISLRLFSVELVTRPCSEGQLEQEKEGIRAQEILWQGILELTEGQPTPRGTQPGNSQTRSCSKV